MNRPPGTILPTAETIRLGNEHANRVKRLQESAAREKLAGIEPRVVGLETRYYSSPDRYAIVSSTGSVLWFRVTADGDFRVKN